MESREPPPKKGSRPNRPNWTSPLLYLPLMFLLLWFWQSTLARFSYHTIPYSEFKEHLARGEVTKCVIREEDIEGEILAKPRAAAPAQSQISTNDIIAAKPGAEPKPALFRTIRVEDPKLVDEFQTAGVKFQGERPSVFSQLLLSWIVPIGIMVLLWSFIGRRLSGAG